LQASPTMGQRRAVRQIRDHSGIDRLTSPIALQHVEFAG